MGENLLSSSRTSRISKFTSLLLFITSIFAFGVVGSITAANAATTATFTSIRVSNSSSCSSTGSASFNYASSTSTYSASIASSAPNLRIYSPSGAPSDYAVSFKAYPSGGSVPGSFTASSGSFNTGCTIKYSSASPALSALASSATVVYIIHITGTGLTPTDYTINVTNNASALTSTTTTLTVKNSGGSTVTSANALSPITLTATLKNSGGSPVSGTGTYNFTYAGSSISGCNAKTLSTGVATCTWNTPVAGSGSLQAVYSADATYAASSSTASSFTVNSNTTTSSITAKSAGVDVTTTTVGAAVTLTATASNSAATGNFNFKFNGTSISGCGTSAMTSGVATCTWTPTSISSAQAITAVYSGDSAFTTSTATLSSNFSVTQASTSATLTAKNSGGSSISTISYGQVVTLTANVTSSSATGSFSFSYGGAAIPGCSSQAISAGQATCSWTTNAVSSAQNLVATYSGDTNYATSSSSGIAFTVTKATTTTSLAANTTSAQTNTVDLLTATVSPNTATGSVEFQYGGVTISGCSSQLISSGSATCSWVPASVASATSVTAYYLGDSNFSTSNTSGTTLNVTVTASAATTATSSVLAISVGGSPSVTSPVNSTITLTATLKNSAGTSTISGTGTFSFNVGGSAISGCSSKALTTGVATCSWSPSVVPSSTSITAVYSGDSTNITSTSSPSTFTVTKANTTSALTAKNSAGTPITSIAYGQAVTLTATVTSSSATGTFNFKLAGASIGCDSQPITGGTATCPWSPQSTYSNSDLTAVYSGDSNYNSSTTTSAITFNVVKATPSVSMTIQAGGSNVTSIFVGNSVMLTATMSPTAATGTITFQNAGTNISTCVGAALVSGIASCDWTPSSAFSSQSITAVYSADAKYNASTSPGVTFTATINSTTGTLTAVDPSNNDAFANRVTSGTVITIQYNLSTTTLAGAIASGTVSFTANGSAISSCQNVTVSGSSAVCAWTTTTSGDITIGATYSGNATYGTTNSSATASSNIVGVDVGATSYSQSTISVSPTTLLANGSNTATITVTLRDAAGNQISASGDTINLSASLGTIGTVTNSAGVYTATYTVGTTGGTETITGTINGNAITSTAPTIALTANTSSLNALALTGGTLSPSFTSGNLTYTTSIPYATTSFTFTPTVTESHASVKYKIGSGSLTAISSASASADIPVNPGASVTVTIEVTAQDGTTKSSYTITATRGSETNSDLSALTISPASLSFSSGTATYNISVANSVSSVNVVPTLSGSYSTMTVNSTTKTSASTTAVSLAVGDNTITIIVTPQSGSAKTYTIIINRASTDATLNNLALSAGSISFSSSTGTYNLTVPYTTTGTTVTPTRNEAHQSITVAGTAVTSGSASSSINLGVGVTQVFVVVTPQEGSTKTYTLNITRTAANTTNTLSNLTLASGVTWSGYSPSTSVYTASVTSDVASITVTPTTSNALSTLTVNGGAATSGTGSGVSLSYGTNTITIVVTSESGSTKTYTITVTRPLTARTISITSATSVTYGNTISLTATPSLPLSGGTDGTITFSAGSSTGCSITGTTLSVTNASGSCSITASIANGAMYAAATSSLQSITLSKAANSISLAAGSALAYKGTRALSATTTGTGTVSYTSSDNTKCQLSGTNNSTLTAGSGTGSCDITATVAADNNYLSNTTTTTFTLSKANQSSFAVGSVSIPNGATADLSTYLSGALSTGSITYSSPTGSCSRTGSVIAAAAGSGSCSVDVTIAGDDNYNSATVTANISLTASAPGKPTGLTLSTSGLTSGGQITFSWTAPVNTGNPDITSYEYQYKLASSGSYSSGVKSTSGTSVTITGLGLGQSYDFQVRARNSMGAGAYADKVTGTSTSAVVAAPTAAPSIASVTPGDGQLLVKFTFSWSAPTDDAKITGYQYSTDGTNWRSITDGDGGDGKRSVTITGLTNGTTYPIYLRALNVAGAGTASASLSGMPFGKPTAPTALTLAKSTNKITVTFTPSDPNGSTISGYQYSKKRGTDDYGDWNDISALNVGPSTDSFDITTSNDDKNKTIYVRVRAKTSNSLGGDGDNRGYSDPSTAGSTTFTLAAPATISAPISATIIKNVGQETFSATLNATPATTETLAYQWYYNTTDSTSGGSPTLPAGVTTNLGVITFTKTLSTSMTGYYYLVVTSTLSGSTATQTSSRVRVIVNPALTVSSSTVTLPGATVGKSYTYSFTSTSPAVFSGGSTPYTWTILSKTNTSGLTDPTSGTVSGNPTTAGTETWNIQVTDASGSTQSTTATLVVSSAPQILTKSLPSGTKNLNYSTLSQTLSGLYGTAGLTWSKVSGPSWVSVDPSTGAISGTPTSSGSNSLKIRYTDANGSYDEVTIVLGVADVVPVQATGLNVDRETTHEVDLSWSASSDESSLSSYVVTYVSPKIGDKDEDRGSVTSSSNTIHSLQIKGLINGRTYTFTVAGKNAGSVGAASTSVTGTPYALPSAPKSVTLVRSNGKLSVRFQKGDDDGGYSVTSYSIQCSTDGTNWNIASGDFTSGGDGEDNNRGYDLRNDGSNTWLSSGASVQCQVAAVSSRGTGAATTSGSLTYQTVPSVPQNVTIDSSTVSSGTITVYFKTSASNGGSAITSYVATLDKDSGGDNESKRSCNVVLAPLTSWDPTNTYSCVIRSVPNKYSGTTSIKIVAVNAIGNSAAASVSISLTGKQQVLKTDDEGGDPSFDGHDPSNLVFNKTYGDSDFAVKLKLDSGLKLNYQVATGTSNCSLTSTQMIHITGVGQCTLSLLQNGKSNEGDGEHETEYSEFNSSSVIVTVNIAPRKPGAPSFVSVASGNQQLTPTINPPAGAVSPTNYIFRYSTSNTGGWSAFDTRTVVSGNAYTLSRLTNGTPYYIEVRSNNSAGSSDPVITSTTYIPYTIPDKPIINSVTIDTNTASATVAWTPLTHPAQSGGSAVTTYRASATLSGTPYSCSVSGSGSSCVITNLPYKQELTFQLSATNLAGSSYSDTQTATVAGWNQSINRGNDPGTYGHTVGDADIQLNATASSALPIQYSTTTGTICSVSIDGSVHLITSGVCTINMAQDGTNSKTGSGTATKYTAAPGVTGWTMNIDPNIPSAPVITSVVNTPNGLQVNWNPPSRLGGGTLTYTVNFTPYHNADGKESTTLNTKVLNSGDINKGDIETITVTAANSIGSSTSTSKSGKWQTVPNEPTTPTAVANTSNGRTIDVTWGDPTDNGGSDVTGFTATATPNAASLLVDPSLIAQSCTTSTHACSIPNLRAGATYSVSIYATNGIGNGPTTTVLGVQPGKSQTVTIAGGNITKNFGAPAFSITASSTSGLTPVFTLGAGCSNATITSAGLFSYTNTMTSCTVNASVLAATASNEHEFISSSATITVTINPVAPNPAVITNVAEGASTLIISWTNPTFIGDGGALTTTVKVDGTSRICSTSPCTVTGLANGSPLAIEVDESNSSGLSATPATGTGTPYEIVEAPTPLTLTPGHGQVIANWSIPVAAASHPLNSYHLQYRKQGDSAFTDVTTSPDTATTSATISGLGDGQIYEARISGVYGDTTVSRWTNIASAKTFWLPDAPQNETLTVVNGGLGSITVSWQAPTDTGGTTLTHYEACIDGSCESLNPSVLSKTYTGLSQNHTYLFTVRTQNVVGFNTTPASSSYTTISTPTAPVLSLTSSDTPTATALLNWTTPADGGSPIISYTLTATPAVGSASTCTVTAPTTTCTMSGLLYKQRYTFVVVATNSAGVSLGSNTVSLDPMTLAQTITFTSPGDKSFATGSVVLNGVASSALPVTYISNATSVCTVPAPSATTNSTVTFVGIGNCSITASQSGVGSNYAAANPTVTVTFAVNAYAPDGIPLLQLAPGASALTAKWDPATQLGGSTLKYYILSFSHNLDWSDESTIHTTSTTYQITGLAPNTSYQVRVAVQTNDFTAPSEYINVLNATTFNVPDAPGIPTWADSDVDPTTGSVTVTWTASPHDGGTPITGYTAHAYYSSDNSDSGQSCTTITESSPGNYSCRITGLKGSRSYTFGATATNAVGSTPSPLSTNTAQPGKTQTLTVNGSTVHHSVKTYNIGATASSGLPITYTFVSETPDANAATGGARHVCVLDPLTGIVSVDLAGTCQIAVSQDGTTDGTTPSDYFATTVQTITITVLGDVSAVPPIVNVTSSSHRLTYTWSAPPVSGDGGLALGAGVTASGDRPANSAFHIQWYDNATPGIITNDYTPADILSKSITGLINGHTYTVIITALNFAGESGQ